MNFLYSVRLLTRTPGNSRPFFELVDKSKQHFIAFWSGRAKFISVFFRIAVKYSREALEKFSQDSAIDGEHGDLIPYLLSKTALSEREVLTIICEFIFAGVDTVSELMHCSNYQTQMSWKVLSVPKNRSVCLLFKHLIPYQGPLMSPVLPRDPLSVHL